MIREMTLDDIDYVYAIQEKSIEHPWSKEMFKEDFESDNFATSFITSLTPLPSLPITIAEGFS